MEEDTLQILRAADALLEGGQLAEATRLYRELLARGSAPLAVAQNLAAALYRQGLFPDARQLLERCWELSPNNIDVALALGMLRLGTGDYRGGWPLYESRLSKLRQFHTEIPPVPAWRGEPLAGKSIVVWREQGLGDMIQCARFLPILREMGARVMVVTLPELVRLFATMGVEARPMAANVSLPELPDFHIHPFSIPERLGTTLESVPAQPYLAAEPRRTGRIGVVWRGSPTHPLDGWRSIPDEIGRRLLDLPGAVHLTSDALNARDLLDTASVVAGLDQVVTVDTAIAHLAGAMGKPVSILLPYYGRDWRWLADRADSPWYPTARLYRQRSPGDWEEVIDRLVGDR